MRAAVITLALLAAAAPAAAHAADPYEEPLIEVHGFASPGFIVTTPGVNYLARSDGGSAEFSEVGINFTKQLTDELRFGLQLFARDLGDVGDYTPRLDWFYLDYRFSDWLGFRAGRVKVPFGLYNETSDVDAAHVPILLPQSIYPVQNRELLLAQTGAELYGYVPLGDAGALDYRVFGGTIFLPTDELAGGDFSDVTADVKYVTGARLLWETPLTGLRIGGSVITGEIDSTATAGQLGLLEVSLDATLWVASIELVAADLTAAAEYSRWLTDTASNQPLLVFPKETTSERAYVSLAYRVTDWFHPSVYYALQYPDVDDREGRESQQHDLALTLRFDVNPHWLWKLEAHYMRGTAALSSSLNGDTPMSELPWDWAAFMLKTTAYF